MGEYNDELKAVRRELKKELARAGVKAKITGHTGSAWGWTEIDYDYKKRNQWTEKEFDVLQNKFGIHIGHVRNTGTIRLHELKSALYGYQARGFKKKQKYKDLKEEFMKCGYAQADTGTCCGGAGTIVMKSGKPIDVWKQIGQSDDANVIAEKIMKGRAEELGLSFKHESGWMD